MVKPTQSPTWATSGSAEIADPGTTKRAVGWITGEPPEAEHLNNEINVVGGWVDSLGCGGDTLGDWFALTPTPPVGAVGTIARAGLIGDVEYAAQVPGAGTLLVDVVSDGVYVHALDFLGFLYTWLQSTMVLQAFSPRGAAVAGAGLCVDSEGWVYSKQTPAGGAVVTGIMADDSGGLRTYTFSGQVDKIACDGINLYANVGATIEAQDLVTMAAPWAPIAVGGATVNQLAVSEGFLAVCYNETAFANCDVIDTSTGAIHVTGDGTTATFSGIAGEHGERVAFSPNGRLYLHTSGTADKPYVLDYVWGATATALATSTTGLPVDGMHADGENLHMVLESGANGVYIAYDEHSLDAVVVQTNVGQQYLRVFSDGDRVYITSNELVPAALVTMQALKAHTSSRRFRRCDSTYPRVPTMGRFAPEGDY